MDEYVDGIVFISLAALDNPESVLPVMAHALGLTDSGDEAVEVLVKRYLRDRRCLLLIDNAELEDAFFPQKEWIIDTVHERILPLSGHKTTTVQTGNEMLRRNRLGI